MMAVGILFLKMVNAHVQNAVDVVIVQRIKYGFPVSARFDQLGAFQNAELMGNVGLRQAQQICNVANAELVFTKRIKNADPRRVAEHLEKFSEIKERFFLGHFLQNVAYDVLVHAEKFAFFDIFFTVHSILPFHVNI